MNRRFVVLESVAREINFQAEYYREVAGPHVALRFVDEVEQIYNGLIDGSSVGVNHLRVKWKEPVKRILLAKFPFAVVYVLKNETVRVIALESMRRRPGYWTRGLR